MKTFFCLFVWRWSNTGLCCTIRLWSIHPCGYSKSDCTTSWTTPVGDPAWAGSWTTWSQKVTCNYRILWWCVLHAKGPVKSQENSVSLLNDLGFGLLKSTLGSKGKTLIKSLLFLYEACVVSQQESKMAYGNPSLPLTGNTGVFPVVQPVRIFSITPFDYCHSPPHPWILFL